MHDLHSQTNYSERLPKPVIWLLSRLTNPAYRDELLGDLAEEHHERLTAGEHTTRWLIRESFSAIWDGQKALLKTTGFIKLVSLTFALLLIPIIALFVGWLSNMHETSEYIWQSLLAGKIHILLFEPEYWREAWFESSVSKLTWGMFINVPSLLWAMAFAMVSFRFLRQAAPSARAFSLLSLAFLLLPYLFGYTVISVLEPAARKIGPIMAFMVLAPFWVIPVYIGYLFKYYPRHP